MQLLQWCTLTPSGPSHLAAVRFSSPSRVGIIRIFPTNSKPFSQIPETTAVTEPEAFFLHLYFNAHPLNTQIDVKQKQKAANALVPSMIAYSGGQIDFLLDMGSDFSTRLMIVSGNFQSVSMAIYGDVATGSAPLADLYQPRPLSVPESFPLSSLLDPCNSSDPTLLARQLLSLVPDSPPLTLIVRLMFCLKPPNDDWELPDFPYLYSDLNEESAEFDFQVAFQCLSRPVADSITHEALQRFAERVADAAGTKSSDQSFRLAGLLCRAASQKLNLAQALINHLDISQNFELPYMDGSTLSRLYDACANVDIAREFHSEWFISLLLAVQNHPTAEREKVLCSRQLLARIRGWDAFEDALSNTQGDFASSTELLKDIGCEEQSFGTWLAMMLTHPDLVDKLAENSVLPSAQRRPPDLLHSSIPVPSHDEFISFVRAYIGVSCVLAVYAWSDSLPNDLCRERALGVLRLWQEVEGYREIVNHLLLLRQMTFRLECMTADNDPPTQCGIHAEQILLNMAQDPRSFLRSDFTKCIASLRHPLSFITEEQRLLMQHAALIAKGGLFVAIEELILPDSGRVLDVNRIRILRLAVSLVGQAIEDEGTDWPVLQAIWKNQAHGLINHLVDVLTQAASDLNKHFGLSVPPSTSHQLIYQLFQISADFLRIIRHIGPTSLLTTRLTQSLVIAVSDVFGCTDAADVFFSQSSPACVAAQDARQACIDITRSLSKLCTTVYQPGRNGSALVLRTLLEQGVRTDDRDPSYHQTQIFCLIDHVIPMSGNEKEDVDPSSWVTSVIPHVLPELQSMFRVLDVESKAHLLKRLINLDRGSIGIGEWLLQKELDFLLHIIQAMENSVSPEHRLVLQYQAFMGVRLFSHLTVETSHASSWCINAFVNSLELGGSLARCLRLLLEANLYSTPQNEIATALSSNIALAPVNLKVIAVLTILRGVRVHCSSSELSFTLASIQSILDGLTSDEVDLNGLGWELGCALSAVVQLGDGSLASTECAAPILAILEWFVANSSLVNPQVTLSGIASGTWNEIYLLMRSTFAAAGSGDAALLVRLETLRSKLTPAMKSPSHTTVLSDTLQLSLQAFEQLLQPPAAAPSTPKRKSPSQDVLGLVALSPPTALLRSPAISGLTKTYTNNDFRQLRQMPSTRQNTSRLPSMHVDEFTELSTSSPTLVPMAIPDVYATGVAAPFNTNVP